METPKGKEKIQETVTGVGNFRSVEAQVVGESSSINNRVAEKFNESILYRLYSKGLVSVETGKDDTTKMLAGFGVAICDQNDYFLFELKEPLIYSGLNRQGEEIKALTRGLIEALNMGIKRIAICCDSYPIFQFVTGKWRSKQKKTSLLLDDLHQIMQQFSYSQPVLVVGKDVKFAYKLARESLVSQVITPHHEDPRQSQKEECVICYNDTEAERMFSVDKCRHRFCFQCVKQHVEVKLLHGMAPKCPHDGCKSELIIHACEKLLTPKLSELWKQRIKENAILVTERVYCPYPRCSTLMSKSKIAESAKSLLSLYPNSGVRRCVECRGLLCVDCKVPWHANLSCSEYKRLNPNPPADNLKLKSLADNKMWRKYGKCQHMIELKDGCNHITCRCGHEFCYSCGGEWNKVARTCTKHCPIWDIKNIMPQDPRPNNYYYDDDDEEDEDDDEDFDFDYGYDDYFFNIRNHMNELNHEDPFDSFFGVPNEEDDEEFDYGFDDDHLDSEPFDPFSDPADGNMPFGISIEDDEDYDSGHDEDHIHFGHQMNDVNLEEPFDPLQQLSLSDDDDDDVDMDYNVSTHTVPINVYSSSKREAEETVQYHSYAPSPDRQEGYIGGFDFMGPVFDYNHDPNDDAYGDSDDPDYDYF